MCIFFPLVNQCKTGREATGKSSAMLDLGVGSSWLILHLFRGSPARNKKGAESLLGPAYKGTRPGRILPNGSEDINIPLTACFQESCSVPAWQARVKKTARFLNFSLLLHVLLSAPFPFAKCKCDLVFCTRSPMLTVCRQGRACRHVLCHRPASLWTFRCRLPHPTAAQAELTASGNGHPGA